MDYDCVTGLTIGVNYTIDKMDHVVILSIVL